jgi:NAD(P)-dependent dehydrogenase (short-subunit alcohol dehydrogenase family)
MSDLRAACFCRIIVRKMPRGRKMDLELNGKVALVTGGNRGIGAAVAAELAREGMHLCLVARDLAKLHEVADTLTKTANVSVQVLPADLRDPAASQQAIAEAVGHFGRLDLLVNNAGATKRADFFTLTEEDWQDGFALKFHGYVRMTRAAWPHLRESKGSIVNIAGIGARAGSAEFTIGGSVNVALLNFTKAMADIGISQGVRVNAVNPGLIATDRFTRNVERVMRRNGLSRDEAMAFLLSSHGTARVGRPEEVGRLVAYLASSKADFIQGSIIDIDGGATRSL